MENKVSQDIYIQDDEIDLAELFRTLFNYKFVILGITIVFSFIGVLYSITATKWYRTVAVVEVGYTKTNNVKNYISNYDEFRVDVLASGAEILDNLNVEFDGIYVDDNVSLSKKRGGEIFTAR